MNFIQLKMLYIDIAAIVRHFICGWSNSMEQSPSWEASSCSPSQEIPCLLWNL